jgi:hypothetical protein
VSSETSGSYPHTPQPWLPRYTAVVELKNVPEEEQELKLRLLRMHQLRIDLEQTIKDVDRHREELVRIKQEVEELTRVLEQRKDEK